MSLIVMILTLICFVRVLFVVDVVIVVSVIVDVVIVVGCYVSMIWRIDCYLRICDWVTWISPWLGWLCFWCVGKDIGACGTFPRICIPVDASICNLVCHIVLLNMICNWVYLVGRLVLFLCVVAWFLLGIVIFCLESSVVLLDLWMGTVYLWK